MATQIASLDYSKHLSSNWKKLQESLQKDTSRPPKRKASHFVVLSGSSKRRRGREQLHTPKKTLNDSSSKSSNVETMTDMTASAVVAAKGTTTTLAQWAEDQGIPARDLVAAYGYGKQPSKKKNNASSVVASLIQVKEENVNEGLSSAAEAEAGKFIAMDCEMVGVGPNPDRESALARISIVNYNGDQLYDSFVLPKESVTDYRTHVSGITPQLLQSARTLELVQKDVAKLLDGRILVGHAIKNDLNVLLLAHPQRDIRDTSKYPPYRALSKGRSPGLKKLAQELLGITIQSGQHSSVEDARATMLLFRRDKDGIEREHAKRWGTGKKRAEGAKDRGSTNPKKQGKKKKKGRK